MIFQSVHIFPPGPELALRDSAVSSSALPVFAAVNHSTSRVGPSVRLQLCEPHRLTGGLLDAAVALEIIERRRRVAWADAGDACRFQLNREGDCDRIQHRFRRPVSGTHDRAVEEISICIHR